MPPTSSRRCCWPRPEAQADGAEPGKSETKWTTEPRDAWETATKTLENALMLAWPKIRMHTVVSRMRVTCMGGTYPRRSRPKPLRAPLPSRKYAMSIFRLSAVIEGLAATGADHGLIKCMLRKNVIILRDHRGLIYPCFHQSASSRSKTMAQRRPH